MVLAALILVAGCAGSGGTHDDPEAAREEAARAAAAPHAARAEGAGSPREALGHWVAAVQAMPEGGVTAEEFRIRRKAIEVAGGLDPAPALPEEAEAAFNRAELLAREAKNEVTWERAAREYEKGLRIAPWWGTAYYNLGLLNDSMNRYGAAAAALRLWVASSPGDPEVAVVKKKIAELEIKQTRFSPEGLAGKWTMQVRRPYDTNWTQATTGYVRVEVSGKRLLLTFVRTEDAGKYAKRGDEQRFATLILENSRLRAHCALHGHGCGAIAWEQTDLDYGIVSEDFNAMTLHIKGMRFHGKLAAKELLSPEENFNRTILLSRAP